MASIPQKRKLAKLLSRIDSQAVDYALLDGVLNEVDKLQNKIPKEVDLEPLYEAINNISKGVGNFNNSLILLKKEIDLKLSKSEKISLEESLLKLEKSTKANLEVLKLDFLNKLNQKGGGAPHRRITNANVDLSTRYADINLIFGGITATAVDNNVTKRVDLTITGSSSGGGGVIPESLTGTQNGVNKVFTVTHVPLFIDNAGQIMTDGNGYTASGGGLTITFDNPPPTSPSPLQSFYNSTGAGIVLANESLIGNQNGSNKVFTVTHTPVFINNAGQVMSDGNGYTLSTLTVTFDNAPPTSPSPLQSFYNATAGQTPWASDIDAANHSLNNALTLNSKSESTFTFLPISFSTQPFGFVNYANGNVGSSLDITGQQYIGGFFLYQTGANANNAILVQSIGPTIFSAHQYSFGRSGTGTAARLLLQGTTITSNTGYFINDGAYHYYGVNIQSTKVDFWRDNILFQSISNTLSRTAGILSLNLGYNFDNDQLWYGGMSNVSIFNRALTTAELLGGFAMSLVGTESGLQAYYKMTETGSTMFDSTSNHNDLTRNNLSNPSTFYPDIVFQQNGISTPELDAVVIKQNGNTVIDSSTIGAQSVAFATTAGGFSVPGSNGDVLFNNSGSVGTDDANFWWDNSNKRLGLKINNPYTTLVVGADPALESTNNAFANFGNIQGGGGEIGLSIGRDNPTSGNTIIQSFKEGVGANPLSINPSGGDIFIGNGAGASLTVYGKITSTGGYDPAYVAYTPDTREGICARVAVEMDETHGDNLVEFYNVDTNRIEYYKPNIYTFFVQAFNPTNGEMYLKQL